MANFRVLTIESGKEKQRDTLQTQFDFLSLRVGASLLPITESSGKFDFGSKQLDSILDPTTAQMAATKAYVDAVRVAARIVQNVRLASTADIDLATGTLLTIDGVTTVANDRVLVKNQADPTENGIYDAKVGAWTRSVDMDNSPLGEIYNGTLTAAVLAGTANAGKKYVITSVGTGVDALHTVGVDNIVWSLFNTASTVTGGNGIDITADVASVDHDGEGLIFVANQLALERDGATLSKSASGLKVADGGIGTTQLANDSVDRDKLAANVVGGDIVSGLRQATNGQLEIQDSVSKTNDNGGSITVRQIVYVKSNGNVDLARANALATAEGQLGVVSDASIATTAAGNIALRPGSVIGGFSGMTPGAPQFLSAATAGLRTETAPSSAGDVYRIIGYAISATQMVFMPEAPIEIIS